MIRGALAGHEQDFEALVERHQRALFAFVCRYLGDEAAADEVVQASFVQAYMHLARFRGDASFKTWLHQIALNQCRALHRAGQRRREVPLDDVEESGLAAPEDRTEMGGWRARLETLVARLPPRQRAVVALRLFGDLPFREVARAEGISENTAKVNYHHAIKRLRKWLSGEDS